MKKIIKTFIASSILFSLVCSPVGAYKIKTDRDDYFYPKTESVVIEKGLYYDDFTNSVVGEKPNGITTSTGNMSDMYISRADVDGKTKNVLTLEHNSGSLSLTKTLDQAEYVTAEVRFRRVNKVTADSPSFVLAARSGGKEVFRIYVGSGKNRIVINSSLSNHSLAGSNNKEVYIEDDVWNTFGIYINTVEHKAGFKVYSDSLKNFTFTDNINIRYNLPEGQAVGNDLEIDSAFEYIDDIRIYTGSYSGMFEIDYINIDNKNKPFVLNKPKPEPLALPITATPGERLVPDVTNVVVNNKVTYYPYYPVMENNIYYAEYKKTFEALGYTAFAEDKIITAYKDKSKVTLDISSGTLNAGNKSLNISSGIRIKDYIMIPVAELAEVLGYSVQIDNNIIYLTNDGTEIIYTPVSDDVFTDLSDTHWAYSYITDLAGTNIVSGFEDGTFKPDASVKREEFIKMLVEALKIEGTSDKQFSDVSESAWYKDYVKTAVGAGIINGISETEFGSGMELTRADMAVMVVRALGIDKTEEPEAFDDDTNIPDYAKESVYILKSNGILSGNENGNFEPQRSLTRAECAKIISLIM